MEGSYHHGNLREALLNAALEGLDREGDVPGLRALAAACGVSRAAPYRHFEDLSALHDAVAAGCFEALTRAIEQARADAAATTSDPRAAFRAGCAAYVRYGLAYPARYALMFSGGAPMRAPVEAAEAFATLRRGVQACGVPPTEVSRRAFAAWAALHGVVDLLRRGFHPPGTSPQDAPAVIEDVVDGVVVQLGLPQS